MPPVTTPIEREPTEETENAALNGFPPHLPLTAMAGVFGPAGQALYAASDVFSDFKVSTIISEFAAGLQQWMLDGATNPDDPRYPGARGKNAAEQSDFLQNYYEAMQLADAHRELWLQGGQDIGGVRISNKELAELADRLATDGDFRQRMKDAIKKWNDPRYDTEEEREKFLTSYQRFIYLDQIGEPARQKLDLQGEWSTIKESPDFPMFKRLNDEAKLDAERTLDVGRPAEVTAEKSFEGTVELREEARSLRRDFAGATNESGSVSEPASPAQKVGEEPAPQTVAMVDQLTTAKSFGL